MIDYNEIGKRIKKVRRQKGMTQCKLAELADLSNPYLSQVETGVKKASLESLAKISRILDVSLDALVFGSDETTDQSK